MLTISYIWSQIFTIIEYSLLGASYLAKKRRLVVTLDILSMIGGIIAYILLGADLGIAMSIIILVANFYYLYDSTVHARRRKSRWYDYLVLAVVLIAIAIATWFTMDGWLSLLSVVATVLYEISIWQKKVIIYKLLGIPVALCWMLYNACLLSIAGVIFEAIALITSIIGYIREVKASKAKAKARAKTNKSKTRTKKRQHAQ